MTRTGAPWEQLDTGQGYNIECLVVLWLFLDVIVWAVNNVRSELIRSAAVLCADVSLQSKIYWGKISRRGDISYHSYVEVYLETDQSLSFLNFSLCYLSGLLAVKDCFQPPTQPLCKAASFLLMLGSKSGFVRGFYTEALTQHEMSIQQAVPPSNHFLLFQSNITRWLLRLWFWTHFSEGNHPQLLHKHCSLLKVLFLYTQDGLVQSLRHKHSYCMQLHDSE